MMYFKKMRKKVRSILLRGFDQQMADHIGGYMENHGMKFIRKTVPKAFDKGETKKVKVHTAHHPIAPFLPTSEAPASRVCCL